MLSLLNAVLYKRNIGSEARNHVHPHGVGAALILARPIRTQGHGHLRRIVRLLRFESIMQLHLYRVGFVSAKNVS